MELEIIEREFSVLSGEKEKAASARGLYRITDNFFRFWFGFVFSNLSDLESGDAEGVYTYFVLPQLNEFAAPVFERICRDFIRRRNRENKLPFRAAKIGRWWGMVSRSETSVNRKVKEISYNSEIDIMAVDKGGKNVLLGECKFRNSLFSFGEFTKLKEKYNPDKDVKSVTYFLFSKSGFTQSLKEEADINKSVILYTLADILQPESRQ